MRIGSTSAVVILAAGVAAAVAAACAPGATTGAATAGRSGDGAARGATTRRGGEGAASAARLGVPIIEASAEVAGAAGAAGAITRGGASASEQQERAAPWTLTASDGSGLALARVDARAVREGPLAFTELHLYFRNDEDRVREGTFQIVLPPRAALCRFAMEGADGWMEAEVVPRLTARRAYDDFLHRRQDPALLEKAAGNQFTARVFPIAPRAEKHLVIGYSQELPGARYVLPLRGLPAIERIDVELRAAGPDGARAAARLSERRWRPDRDFEAATGADAAAVGAGELWAAAVELGGGAAADAPAGLTLLVDTSASRALGFGGYLAAIRRLIGEARARWGDALPLDVVAFDQDAERVFEGRAADFGDAHVARLAARGAAGASDVGQALAWIAAHGRPRPRVVVIGDGVITAGAEGPALGDRVRALAGAGVARLDVALAGGLRDERVAALLASAGLPRAGAVLDLDADPAAAAAALGEAVVAEAPIEVRGAVWSYPRAITGARAGARVMVYARLPRAAARVEVIAGGRRQALPVSPADAPLVERAIAGAELAELEARRAAARGEDAARLRALIAQRSVAARVLSSETAMLVLESDADYARYGIERRAPADVLAIGAGGVERRRRGAAVIAAGPAARPAVASRPDPRAAGAAGPSATGGEPAPDNDRDGILDADDRCPEDPETLNGAEDDDGCPDRGRVIVTSAAVEVLDQIHFTAGGAALAPAAYPLLDAVARVMAGAPDIELVEIQGHTDERGDARQNLELSDRRARAVQRYLVDHGIAAARLTAQGYGATQPLDRAHAPAAWAKNRRVEFLILRRAGGERAGPAPASAARASAPAAPAAPAAPPRPPPPPVTGELAAIRAALAAGDPGGALARARAWHAREPGDVLALVGLGEALEAGHAAAAAARAYGSIIDLFPGRADLRRFAAERLARLPAAAELAIDTLRRAVADRPDHLTGHRLLAYALVRAGRPADGFAAILAGLDERYREGTHAGGHRVLADDAALIGAAYAAAAPARRAEIAAELARRGLAPAAAPSTRFVLYWETDASDVDLHVEDARGGHASFRQPRLPSGGELYADVTTGYGPECFAIPGAPRAGPYRLWLEYYAQGPMGYGMGLLQIQRFDPHRGLSFEDRPYVVMTDHARVDLGLYHP